MFLPHALKSALISLLLLAGAVVCAPVAAAPLAANTRIVNTATITYNEGSGALSATVTVTMNLVPALPTVTASDALTIYAGPGTTVTIPLTVIANSNGPESYTLNPAVTSSTNTAGATVAAAANFTLGASVTIPGSSQDIIQVPSDGITNSLVNGLGVGETIAINGETRIITAISDPTDGIATLTLDQPLTSAPGSGVLLAEQRIINITVSSGAILSNGVDITALLGTTVSNGAGTTVAVTPTATYTSTTLTLIMYARNLSRPEANTPALGARSFTINGATNNYYLSNVTAQQGEIIEYVLVMTNNGTGTATTCAMINPLPPLVTQRLNTYGSGDLWLINPSGDTQTQTWAGGDDTASLNGTTLTVNVGNGATATLGGALAAGQNVIIAYQVMINN